MEEKKKSKKGVVIIIVLLIIIILGLVGYILVDKDIIKLSSKADKETGEKPKDKLSEKDVEKLLQKYNIYDENNSIIYYQGGSIATVGYTKDYKKYVAYNNVKNNEKNNEKATCEQIGAGDSLFAKDNYNIWTATQNDGKAFGMCYDDNNMNTVIDTTRVTSYKSVAKSYKELFNDELEKESFEFTTMPIYYSKNKDGFVTLSCNCGGTTGPYIQIDKIKDYNVDEDILTVNIYYEHLIPTSEEYDEVSQKYNYEYNLFKQDYVTYNTKEMSEDQIKKDIINNHLNSIDVYKIVFKKVNDKYIFDSFGKKLS